MKHIKIFEDYYSTEREVNITELTNILNFLENNTLNEDISNHVNKLTELLDFLEEKNILKNINRALRENPNTHFDNYMRLNGEWVLYLRIPNYSIQGYFVYKLPKKRIDSLYDQIFNLVDTGEIMKKMND